MLQCVRNVCTIDAMYVSHGSPKGCVCRRDKQDLCCFVSIQRKPSSLGSVIRLGVLQVADYHVGASNGFHLEKLVLQ